MYWLGVHLPLTILGLQYLIIEEREYFVECIMQVKDDNHLTMKKSSSCRLWAMEGRTPKYIDVYRTPNPLSSHKRYREAISCYGIRVLQDTEEKNVWEPSVVFNMIIKSSDRLTSVG